jgi:hypothetical protein
VFSTIGENMEQSVITELLNKALSTIDNTSKKYGFNLLKIPCNKSKSGFQYAIRYKDFETNKWLPLKKSSGTDSEEIATIFAIDNRETIIRKYYEKKSVKITRTTFIDFYQMLQDYYQRESKYLKDDCFNVCYILFLQNGI